MWQNRILPLSLYLIFTISFVKGQIFTTECQSTECNLNDPFVFVNNGSAISFEAANAACQRIHGTNLAVINSMATLYAANSTCIEKGSETDDTPHCWIGLKYNSEGESGGGRDSANFDESKFEWVDGTPTNVTLNNIGFGSGEPGGYVYYEDCVEIRGDGSAGQMNQWNDVPCSGATRTYDISMFLCDNPHYGNGGCVCDCGCCMINGDPHITGFDQLLWHFMGQCSYYYVTTCDEDRTLETGIPFEISGEHYSCYPSIEGRTCMNNTYVRFYTSEDPPQLAAIVKLGEGYLASFVTDETGSPGSKGYTGDIEFDKWYSVDGDDSSVDNSEDNNGDDDDDDDDDDEDDGDYKFRVYIGNNELVLEGYFTRADYDYDYFDLKIAVSADYTSDGHGSYANIYLSQCFQDRTCGLCGVWDGDTINDFTYVDEGNIENSDGSIYTTEEVSDIFALAADPDLWTSVQEFGFEWTDTDLVTAISQNAGICYDSPVPLEIGCLTSAYAFCQEIGCSCDADGFSLDSWLSNCAFDACAISNDTLDDTTLYPSLTEAEATGYFNGAKLLCWSACKTSGFPTRQPTEPTTLPTQPVPSPTTPPTKEPTPLPSSPPTYSPTFSPTALPTKSPTKDPTPQPTPVPSPNPTPAPQPPTEITPTAQPTSLIEQCDLDDDSITNFFIVIDRSTPLSNEDCQLMNEFLLNLVSLISDDEEEDDSSVTIIEYGNSEANVIISFDMSTRTSRQQLIAAVSNSIDYCDSTKNDNDHYCQEGIDLAINEITENSGSTIGDNINNVLVLIQNGPCSDDENTCNNNGTLKEQIETLNIRTIVLNFGPNANSDENTCIVTETGDEQRYEDDISNTMTFLETFGEMYFCRDVNNDFDDSCNFVEPTNTVIVIDRSTPFSETTTGDDDDEEDLLPCEEMNEFLINLVRNRANEEFGRISIVEYDNDDTPQIILSLNDVPLNADNRRDTIIQTVMDNVDYCDDTPQPGDENNYCQEGIEAGVMEMMNNGNIDDGDNNVIIVIQNGECNENPDICQETDNNGNTLVERLELSDIKLVVLNVGPDAIENETECIVTYDGAQVYESDIPTMQEELEDTNIFCREVNTTTPTNSPTTSPSLRDSCTMPNKKNFAVVIDQSEAFDDETCNKMNTFLTNLVSQLIDENESRVSIIEYGSNSASILIDLNEFPLTEVDRKDKLVSKLEETVDYCDNSTNDENHYCKQGIDLAKQEIFDNGNIVTDPTQSPGSQPDENFLIILQNGDCNDDEDVCDNGDFKYNLENVNVKSYVFNFGPNAVKDENDCIITDNYNKDDGADYLSFNNDEDMSEYIEDFLDKTCEMFGQERINLYPTNDPVSPPSQAPPPSQPPITDSCYLERNKNFVIVIDRSRPIGNNNEDCELMNEFIVDLVGLVLDEDYGRVGIVEYGNNGANVVISLNDYPISNNWSTRRDTLIDAVISNVNYCDDSKNDNEHFCQEGIEMGRDDIIAYGNIDDGEENVLIVIQNGECNENDDICNDDTFVNELLSNNIESYVLNFGPDAVQDENSCIATEEQVYANDFQMLQTFLDHSEDRFCHKQPTSQPSKQVSSGGWWKQAGYSSESVDGGSSTSRINRGDDYYRQWVWAWVDDDSSSSSSDSSSDSSSSDSSSSDSSSSHSSSSDSSSSSSSSGSSSSGSSSSSSSDSSSSSSSSSSKRSSKRSKGKKHGSHWA